MLRLIDMQNIKQYRMLTHCLLVCILFQQLSAENLRGHLKPLGEQRPPDVVTKQAPDGLHPIDFWEKFEKPGTPVLFPGAAKNFRASQFWTEEYLIQNYGKLAIKLEARAESNERIPVGELGLGKDTIKHFIENYQKMDAYVISQIPQPMEDDIELPSCLRCGTFLQNIQETHLFLSAGGGKTLLHQDPYSSVHCVFNGTKEWLTIHPSQTHLIYQNEESQDEYGGFSIIDVDHVDLEMFPRILDVKYSKVNMNKGDCIFMPEGYWHQVRSNGYMNTAVSIWFTKVRNFNSDNCPAKIPPPFPLGQVDVIWRYPGNGDFTQGNHDIYIIQRLLLSWADEHQRINLESFTKQFFVYDKTNDKLKVLQDDAKRRSQKFLELLDSSGSGFISQDEVRNMSRDELKEITLLFAPTDVSNTLQYEYSHIEENKIRALFKQSFKDSLFDQNIFIRGYTEILGGTLEKASEIISKLLVDQKTGVYKELAARLSDALSNYRNSRIHDPTMEQELHKHLSFHDEL